MLLQNVCGGVPGLLDKATFGHPGRYSYCIGESPVDNPWESLDVARGFGEADSAVTAFAGEAPINARNDWSDEPGQVLATIADAMKPSHYTSGSFVIVVGPLHAALFARAGLARRDVQEELFLRARAQRRRHETWTRPGRRRLRVRLSPRPESFAGLVVGYLDNGKPNSDRLLDLVAARLVNEGVSSAVRARKDSIERLAEPEIIDDLVARCDVVITGVGDCAGCCSCTVQDGITLERRGIPTYVICTSELVTIAHIAAKAAGIPEYPLTVVEHPLGSLSGELLAERAEDAIKQVTAARTA